MKKKIAIFAALVAIVGALFVAPVASAASDPCDLYQGEDKELICGKKGSSDAYSTIRNVLNTVYLYVGIIATIVIIIGGVFYMTSQGDPSKLAKAKNTIIYAAIGLIVTLSAFAITNFVVNAIGGSNDSSQSAPSDQPDQEPEDQKDE
ncbi:hypothetical protein J6X13_03105 [Candidatus Saccharibacteria bacterium]|nr:hypothetical protein [Candidatus Saccharibacteria bacterium]